MSQLNTEKKHFLVLIVDDDKLLRQILSLALSKTGFFVAEASTGEEAVKDFEKLRPDAILLDVIMPGIDGFETCQKIRQIPGGEKVPIIMITGQDDYDSITKAYESGATDFAVKPINPLLLSYRIRYILRASKAMDDLDISEIKLAAAQEIAKLGHWHLDLTDNRISWNLNVCRIFCTGTESFDGDFQTFLDLVHPADLETVETTIKNAIASRSGFHFEHRIVPEENEVRIIQQEGKVIVGGNGSVVKVLFTSQDITRQKATEEEVKFLAFYDRLTELPNRLLFKEHLGKAINDARRNKGFLAVLCIDIDSFRAVNDTFGREVGDELLKMIASRLKICLRLNDTTAKVDEYDLTARFGADEFGVILEGLNDLSDAAIVARRILDCISEVMHIEDREIYLHSRIGLSVFPDDGDEVEVLMKNADAALSRAKELEKNSYQFFTADLNTKAFARFALEASLRRAVELQQFVLYYQPQVDMKSGTVSGVEALIRWQHPEMGMISPMEFIPVAEDSGLIVSIGDWVIRTACEQCKAWADQGWPICVAINLSAGQFRNTELVGYIDHCIKESCADPGLLEFEITESMLMDDVEGSIERLDKLRSLGVRLSIDDFGTGYSSLNYLKRFPVSALKVDRSFVSDITTSADDAMIVKAVVTLAKNLDLEVVAEGVEEKEHLEFLYALGCDIAQGFLISRPVPSEAVEKFFENWTVKDL